VPKFFVNWASLMKKDPIRVENAFPKIATIQALLADILNDDGADETFQPPWCLLPPVAL